MNYVTIRFVYICVNCDHQHVSSCQDIEMGRNQPLPSLTEPGQYRISRKLNCKFFLIAFNFSLGNICVNHPKINEGVCYVEPGDILYIHGLRQYMLPINS